MGPNAEKAQSSDHSSTVGARLPTYTEEDKGEGMGEGGKGEKAAWAAWAAAAVAAGQGGVVHLA